MRREYKDDRQTIVVRGPGVIRRIGGFIVVILAVVGVITIVGLINGWFGSSDKKVQRSGSKEAIVQEEEKFHGIILTDNTVMSELKAIAELMTYSHHYAGTATVVDSVQIPYTDVNIWGTQHTIDIMYTGTIKVGYNLKDIQIKVNELRKEIYVMIPQVPTVVDNNIPQENVSVVQDNNPFNPIRANEVNERLAEIKADRLDEAIKDGIYDQAETHLRQVIVETLAQLHTDYKVVFSDMPTTAQ